MIFNMCGNAGFSEYKFAETGIESYLQMVHLPDI